MGKHGFLQISIIRVGDHEFNAYAPTKKNKLIPINKIINDYEKRVKQTIVGDCDFGCLDFKTNYNYEYFSDHFDDWIEKYDLTISIFHSFENDADYGDRTELYYLGRYAVDYTLDNIDDIHTDDILDHTLTETNQKIIKKMRADINKKIIQLLEQQRDDI